MSVKIVFERFSTPLLTPQWSGEVLVLSSGADKCSKTIFTDIQYCLPSKKWRMQRTGL